MKPAHFYFDDSILTKEQHLFRHVRYLAHEEQLRDHNYFTIPQENDGRVLIKQGSEYHVLSNWCRHRQATMLKGSGNTVNITCPLHGWTYNKSEIGRAHV